MPKIQSTSSTETILVPVTHLVLGERTDPTDDPVFTAFLPVGRDPTDADAHHADWQTWPGPVYYAGCLVGPVGGVELVKGRWIVWVKVTDDPEIPWLPADTLIIV